MKYLVTGAKGQLGRALLSELERRGLPCTGTDIDRLDLTDAEAVEAFVAAEKPDVILHCAGYTAVDRAESEPEVCMAANAGASLNLARAALTVDAAMLLVSSDYVFSGAGERPWETADPREPLNV